MKKKILIIEDDQDNAELLSRILHFYGYDTVVYINLVSVIDVLLVKPDLVVLDHNLREGYGGHLCHGLKSIDATRNIPILMVSANDTIAEIAEACGANDYMRKPFDINDLKQKVSSILFNR